MADRIKHLSHLLENPDAKVRLYALGEIIRNAHRVTEKELADALRRASSDGDRSVSMRAAEGLSILEQRGFKQLRRARDRGTSALTSLGQAWEENKEPREAAFRILDGVLEVLEDLCGDLSVKRANLAIDALGMFRHPASLGPLNKALARRDTAEQAARAIGRFPEETALPLFLKLLQDPPFPEATGVALEGLGDLHGSESFQVLEKHAASPDQELAAAVASALGCRKEKETEELLIRLIRHPSPQVVKAAVDSLGMTGEGKAAEALHALFVDAGDPKVQARILTALGLIHRNESVETLAKGLRSSDGRVRANAVEALASYDLREPEAVRHFAPILRDDNNRARANAILALYPYDRNQAVAALQRMLKAKEPRNRSSAAYIIGELQDPMLMQGLITMINTEQDRDVLDSSLRSIERIRNPEMKMGISKLCRHPNDHIRGRSIQIFAGLSGISEVRVLENYFKRETSPTVKSTIVAAMGLICDINHLGFLKSKLRDRDDRIVANAIESLDRVGALENAELLEPLLIHPSPRVRTNALVAMWRAGSLKSGDGLGDLLDSSDDDQLSSALHAAKRFAFSISPIGFQQYPMLRAALHTAYQNFSTIGETAWDAFKTSRFYQDVIMGASQAEPTPEEIAEDAVRDDLEPGKTGSLPVISAAGVVAPPPKAAPVKQEATETKAEIALVASLGCLLSGRARKALDFLAKVPEGEGVAELLDYVQQRAAREAGLPPTELTRVPEEEDIGFLPVHALKIEGAKRDGDFSSVLGNYFSLYRAQLSVLYELVQLGEKVLGDGDEASAARIAKQVAQVLKGDASLHRTLGDRHCSNRVYRNAYPHLLRAWVYNPDDPELLLKLASVTARTRRPRLARQMLRVLLDHMEDVPSKLQEKAEELVRILDRKKL